MSESLQHDPCKSPPFGPQVREALERLTRHVLEGLKHGFFEYTISCEVGPGGRRDLVIRAGKSDKFTIPKEELPR